MVKLAKALSHFQPVRAMVIGDYLLDAYTSGKVRRISPEAPVPILEVQRQESLPGGAGNVTLNMRALGAQVIAVGRTGDDLEGDRLRGALGKAGIDLQGLLVQKDYHTPIKNRLIADSQQLLRIDHETIAPIPLAFEESVMEKILQMLPEVQVIALSDYGKGFLTPTLIAKVIHAAKKANIPLLVDPKGTNFTKYRGATLLKPNLSEAYAAAGMTSEISLDVVAEKLLSVAEADLLMVTRSEAGISLFDRNERRDFPVRSKEVKDVTGAGDTVLAMIGVALANGLEIGIATQLANIAAGIAIERLGCVQVTLQEIAQRLLEIDVDSKVFDECHTFVLQQVLQGKRYNLLLLPQGQKITNTLFCTLKSLSIAKSEVVVYLQEASPDDELLCFLSSLSEVNYIIVHTESLESLCLAIHPQEIFFLEREQLKKYVSPKEMLFALKRSSLLARELT